jgi:hypothetical protein
MKIMEIESRIIERIKKKHGNDKLRQALRMFQAGIPERNWFTEGNQPNIHTITENLDNNRNVIVMAGSSVESADIASAVTKYYMNNMIIVKQFDFIGLMEKFTDRFNQCDFQFLDNVRKECDLVTITGIKGGNIYLKYKDAFMTFVNGLVGGIFTMKVVLSVDFVEENEFVNIYGSELSELVNSGIFEIIDMAG